MLARRFQIVSVDDSGIRVKDIRSDHEFAFRVHRAEDGVREIASQAAYWLSGNMHLDYRLIGQRAREFAKCELERRGLIDRLSGGEIGGTG